MNSHVIKLHEPTKVPIERLVFDLENPRYSEDRDLDAQNDKEIITFLLERADLQELIESIANSGYVDIEPLVVMQMADDLIVLEGNRRLAALRLLREPALAQQCKVQLPAISKEVATTLSNKITVYAVENRSDARDFIGFKHINGPHRWDSIAKARFAANWLERDRATGTTLVDIANRMGDRHDTIKRMVAGIFVLDQAKKNGLFDVRDRFPGRPFAFSHLYTALTRPGYRKYLGLSDDWRSTDPKPDPVPEEKLDNLQQLMRWVYGSDEDGIRPIVTSQNPHIKQLGEVLQKPKAMAILSATSNLSQAYAEVDTPFLQFESALVKSHQHAEDALKKVAAYNGSDLTIMEVASELKSNVSIIHDTMTSAIQRLARQEGNIDEDEQSS